MTLGIFKMRGYISSEHGCCIKCNYNLRGTDHDVCPECGTKVVKENMGDQARRKSALQVVMHAWYPGKRAVWWGILGFLISFIVYGFIAHRDIDYWDTQRWYWIFPGLVVGMIVGPIACYIGGVMDKIIR